MTRDERAAARKRVAAGMDAAEPYEIICFTFGDLTAALDEIDRLETALRDAARHCWNCSGSGLDARALECSECRSTRAADILAACPIRRANRPRACEVCGRTGEVFTGFPRPLWTQCPTCRGTGYIDDWRGDGVVRLTTSPEIESHYDPRERRHRHLLIDPDRPDQYLSAFTITDAEVMDYRRHGGVMTRRDGILRLLNSVPAWKGVNFELPAGRHESAARTEIHRTLQGIGFTSEEVDHWDRLDEYTRYVAGA